MRLGQDDMTQIMGIGAYGEVRTGPDGQPYQWVQGIDGLGNPIGFWKRLRRLGSRLRKFARKALPIAQRFATFIPGAGPALQTATPFMRQAGILGYDGLGALYQAPDGAVYRVDGFAQGEEPQGFAEDEPSQVMGIGTYGEVRTGPDGQPYQWVQGIDGLGNPIGFWKRLRRLRNRLRKFARKALPIAQRFAPFVPGAGAALQTATPFMRRAGILGQDGLGALYEAADGTIYQVRGLAEDEELRGFAEDDELRGLAEDEDLRGLAEEEDLRGLSEDEELRGFAEDEELRGLSEEEELRGLNQDEIQGLAEEEELRGFEEDYVRQGMNGMGAFVPDASSGISSFSSPSPPPEMWKPLW